MVFVNGSKYPWDKWSDGHAWRVQQRVDFTCYGTSMAGLAYGYARKNNLAVATSVFEYPSGDDIVFLMFFDRDNLWKPNFKAFADWREEQRRHARFTRS